MSARLVLVTGGCRSGKSAFALDLAERYATRRIFLATCPVLDHEMAERVRRHREERMGRGWETLETPVELAGTLAAADSGAVVLVDCLTLWINNLLHEAEQSGHLPTEDEAALAARRLALAARERKAPTVVVTNEVGMGIVPANALARRFRDLAGRVNATMAAAADEVHLLVSGVPLRIK